VVPVTTSSSEAVAAALLDAASWLRREATPTRWSAVALSTLDALDRRGPQRISDLVAQEHITQPGMTGLVGRLTAAGLITRTPDPTDRRASLLRLTGAGRAHLAEVRRSRIAVLVARLDQLSEPHRAALNDAVPALAALAGVRPPQPV
jgi:DNA-binding MarR family transcriptional regulator